MILVDPVIFSKQAYGALGPSAGSSGDGGGSGDSQDPRSDPRMQEAWKNFIQAPWIKKRQSAFKSVRDFSERLSKRTPYSKWNPRVQKDFFEHAVHQKAPGKPFELLCAPTVEFWNYAGSYGDSIPELELKENQHKIFIPVRIMRSGLGQFEKLSFSQLPQDVFQTSPTDPLLYKRFPRAVDELIEGYGHFFPQEAPALLLRRVLAYAGPPLRVPDKPSGPPAKKPPRRARL